MGSVKNNSTISITRTLFSSTGVASFQNLGSKLFNGYVYNFSLDVGANGDPTTLVLNLALDKTLKFTKPSKTIQEQRKEAIQDIGSLNSIGVGVGNIGTGPFQSQKIDPDFNIDEKYLGVESAYNISIIDEVGNASYQLKNFRIVSYSINKKDDQKILSLVLKDISFVLSKIYVSVLGQELALDSRSEVDAVIDQIKINCPPVGAQANRTVIAKNFTQTLHFAGQKLANTLKQNYGSVLDISSDESSSKKNYIVIKSANKNKSIANGYGAVIILGEEEFRDGPCDASEIYYSFDTLLAAMEKLGISTIPPEYISKPNSTAYRTLKDKSLGTDGVARIKRNYRGNLKDVLNQWCEEYGFSYFVAFSSENTSSSQSILIKGIDLSSPTSKESVMETKNQIEKLEAEVNQEDFVIKSQEFGYDLSQKLLRLYSSYYFKESKEKGFNYENFLATTQFKPILLNEVYPALFGNGSTTKDFSGSNRSYEQVLISAILGKFAPKLRQIYNVSIGAFSALGFVSLGKINAIDNPRLIFQEAVTKALDIQADVLYDSVSSQIAYDMRFGFFNDNLASQVEKIENFIADFVGAYYWTDPITISEGTIANQSFSASFEVETSPPTQKIFADQLYKLEPFRELNLLVNEMQSVFKGTSDYYQAFKAFANLQIAATDACENASREYLKMLKQNDIEKTIRFYYKRPAAYGVLQDFLTDIQTLKYYIAPSSEAYDIDLSEIYAPIFKELSPVSIGVLQSALPLDIASIPIGHYKFGILLNFKKNIFSFTGLTAESTTNPIEYQNYIRERCEIMQKAYQTQGQQNIVNNKRSCNKTILYTTCVQSAEQGTALLNISDQLKAASGPDPLLCSRFSIVREAPPAAVVQANINKTLISSSGFMSLNPTPLQSVILNGLRFKNLSYLQVLEKNTKQIEAIVLPSQRAYAIRLVSKTSQEIFMPFQNYVRGGIEDKNQILNILTNDGFGVDLFLNNITPNIRELLGDQTTPTYSTDQYLLNPNQESTPYIMSYKGYGESANPMYETKTFEEFHNVLSQYYNRVNLSLRQPIVIYSAEFFCVFINEKLKNLLSVFKGLSKLNITFGSGGLVIQAEFRSSPEKLRSVESLIAKNRPNIKLINTNSLK